FFLSCNEWILRTARLFCKRIARGASVHTWLPWCDVRGATCIIWHDIGVIDPQYPMTPMFWWWMRTMTTEFFKVIRVCWGPVWVPTMRKVWAAAQHNIEQGSG